LYLIPVPIVPIAFEFVRDAAVLVKLERENRDVAVL
jgi:hypothetical protein